MRQLPASLFSENILTQLGERRKISIVEPADVEVGMHSGDYTFEGILITKMHSDIQKGRCPRASAPVLAPPIRDIA